MPHRATSCDQRNGVAAVRVAHKHNVVIAPVQISTHHIGKGVEARRVVIDWQVHRDHGMSGPQQERSQPFPTPRAVPRTVYQGICRHAARVRIMTVTRAAG